MILLQLEVALRGTRKCVSSLWPKLGYLILIRCLVEQLSCLLKLSGLVEKRELLQLGLSLLIIVSIHFNLFHEFITLRAGHDFQMIPENDMIRITNPMWNSINLTYFRTPLLAIQSTTNYQLRTIKITPLRKTTIDIVQQTNRNK